MCVCVCVCVCVRVCVEGLHWWVKVGLVLHDWWSNLHTCMPYMDSVTTEFQQGVGIHVRLEVNGAGGIRNVHGMYVSLTAYNHP